MSVFILILWLNIDTGAIEGATKVGAATSVIECQTVAAKKLDDNAGEVAKAREAGRVPFVTCVDVSAYTEQRKRAADSTRL